jgi:hypothetical protein
MFCKRVNYCVAIVTRGGAVNFIVAENKKANLKHDHKLKLPVQARSTLPKVRNETRNLFATEVDFTHPQVRIFELTN